MHLADHLTISSHDTKFNETAANKENTALLQNFALSLAMLIGISLAVQLVINLIIS